MKVLTAKYETTRQKKSVAATIVAVRYRLLKRSRRFDFPATAPDSQRGDSGTPSRPDGAQPSWRELQLRLGSGQRDAHHAQRVSVTDIARGCARDQSPVRSLKRGFFV